MRILTKAIPCCALIMLAGLQSPALRAQKGNVPLGKIYFTHAGSTWSMNGDGSAKTPLPAGVSGEPSRLLHGGRLWFLQIRDVPGQTYPSGRTRRELFAVRDDANPAFELQLTTQLGLELGGSQRWNPRDTKVSWMARRWDLTLSQVLAGGVYEADILFDGAGNVTGLGCTGPLAISVTAMPSLGRATFAITCGNAPPNTTGLLAFTGSRFPSPVVVLGIEVWVDPSPPFVPLSASSNNIGASEVPLPIPNDPALAGVRLFAQLFWVGPTSPPPCPPFGLSASNALEITIQP